MSMRFTMPALGLAAILAACGPGERPLKGSDATVPAAQSASPVGGMQGMQGMSGMQGGAMMAQMQAHMDTMMGTSAGRMAAMLPLHRQMVANMLAQMNQEMRSTSMTVEPRWTALVDSLRQDLVRMPEMSPAELKEFMTAHQARVTRLMAMHQAMMGNMKP